MSSKVLSSFETNFFLGLLLTVLELKASLIGGWEAWVAITLD